MWIKITSVSLQISHTALTEKNTGALPSWLLVAFTSFVCFSYLMNFFFSILCFFPSADLISARILVLFLPTFLVCAKGVSAVADPFLKIRVTKSCFDLDLADPQALLPQGTWLVLVEGWGGERHLRKARQKFCCHGPVSLQILSMEEL